MPDGVVFGAGAPEGAVVAQQSCAGVGVPEGVVPEAEGEGVHGDGVVEPTVVGGGVVLA